jgi:GNAT superfamily N-acetyltransferase
MNVRYTDSLAGITAEMLAGFFEGWRQPPSPDKLLRILRGSSHVILAIDDDARRVVGLINALGDGGNSAFIPLLEVLPAYRRKGVGGELVRRMLQTLRDYPCIDLTCDPQLQSFYQRHGMTPSVGMVVRDYSRPGPSGERGHRWRRPGGGRLGACSSGGID